MAEEVKRLIQNDNVEELSKILNSDETLRNNFNTFYCSCNSISRAPLLHFAVQENRQKVVEYFLSQDFVDKRICNSWSENIYHVICKIRGADQLFSIIERNVPHHLLLDKSHYAKNAFYIACYANNIFIVKRVYEIMESLKVDILPIRIEAMNNAIFNQDIEVAKYILSMDGIGIQLTENIVYKTIGELKFDIVAQLLNVYLCQSIPSHLHNQFHIFQFSNYPSFYNNCNNLFNKNGMQNDKQNIEDMEDINPNKIQKRDRDDYEDSFMNHNKKRKLSHHINHNINCINDNININCNNNINNTAYLKLVEKNFQKLMDINIYGNRIWHGACSNADIDVVRLIFSLKVVQSSVLNEGGFHPIAGYNLFLFICKYNSNIKVIKYIHKLFPSFIHSQINHQNGSIENAAYLIVENSFSRIPTQLNSLEKLQILHYLYLNGINIHFLSLKPNSKIDIRFHLENNLIIYDSIYSIISKNDSLFNVNHNLDDVNIMQYLKVISQDFDYQNNEHNDETYRKPSFWKEFHNNNNNNNNNNSDGDEQSIRVNEWKNRFDEHVLHHLSKMIQEWMLISNQHLIDDDDDFDIGNYFGAEKDNDDIDNNDG